jgi:phosphinothricin acetyltransferase
MVAADWPDVARIYGQGIETGNATFETSVPEWPEWDVGHLDFSRLVAEDEGEIVAWAALSSVSERAAYRGVAEHSIYVAAVVRGQGVGSELLGALITSSEDAGIWTLQTAIFPENASSIRLHVTHGFRVIGIRERIGQHHGRWRDTVLMERRSSRVGL